MCLYYKILDRAAENRVASTVYFIPYCIIKNLFNDCNFFCHVRPSEQLKGFDFVHEMIPHSGF